VSSLHDWHVGIGWFLVLSNAIVGVWALAAQTVMPLRHAVLWWAIGLAQISAFGSAGVGVLIVNTEDVELEQFHALYGFTTIIAIGILYSYRTSPFIKDKQYLLYGFGSLFLMGLGIRNFYLDPTVTVAYIPIP
jgi:hypothetical protein